jgi:hypothetical protein
MCGLACRAEGAINIKCSTTSCCSKKANMEWALRKNGFRFAITLSRKKIFPSPGCAAFPGRLLDLES